MSDPRFPILFTGLNRILVRLGLTERRAFVAVGPTTVTVRMGWLFRAEIARTAITGVAVEPDGFRRQRRFPGWGVHGWDGRWLVNGSSSNIVRLDIDPRQPGRTMGWPLRLRELRVSVVDPGGLVAALTSG